MRTFAVVAISIATAAVLEYGCSTASGTDETYSFRDAAGRQCTAKRFPPKASCDQAAPKTCGAGTAACFIVSTGQLEVDGGIGGPRLVRNCASCCNDSDHSSSSMTADCIPLVCTSDSDCAGEPATCIDGQCQAR